MRRALLACVILEQTSPALSQDESQHYPKTLRYDEDYSYLADPALRKDDLDPVKYVPLSRDGAAYLSLGGELRERFEATTNPSLGFTGVRQDTVLLHRLLLSADLHLSRPFRTFVQLGAYSVSGRKGPPLTTDKNRLDLQQAFIDFASADGAATVRVGRQEMRYGSGRFVATREGPNGRRSFDGIKGMYRSQTLDADLLAARTVKLKSGTFDDAVDDTRAFWGLYVVKRFPDKTNLDIYYFGVENENAVYAAGAGRERRRTVGARFWGSKGRFDYNVEAVYQFGTLADLDIRAHAASADLGYELANVPLRPRLGIKANVESGDGRADDGTLGTLNPLFPNNGYFSEAAFGAPMNSMDVQPNVTLRLAPQLSFLVGWDFFWKHREADAIYNAGLLPYFGTAGRNGRYIGTMITTHARWQYDRHWEFDLDFTRFDAGEALRQAAGKDSTFIMASAAYRF